MFYSLLLSILLVPPQSPEGPGEAKAPQDEPRKTPELQPVEKKVVVTGTRHESDPLDVPSSITVIGRDEIEKSAARTIVDLLQGRPGLQVAKFSSNPQDAIVDVRGFNNGSGAGLRTMVLVDGRKVNTVTGNSVDWAALPLENIERIEIVRGPGAALYGDGAVGAVIQIITRKAGEKPRHAAAAEVGSFASHRETAAYSATWDPVGVALTASRGSADGFRDNSAYDAVDGTGTIDFAFGPGTAWAAFALHDDRRERPGSLTKAEISLLGRDASVTGGDFSDVATKAFNLGADWTLSGATVTPLLTYMIESLGSRTTGFGGDFRADDDSDKLALGLKAVRAFGAVTALVGLEGALERAEAESIFVTTGFTSMSDSSYDRTLLGVYGRLEWRVVEKLLISGSLRYDRAHIEFERTTADTFTPATTLEGDRDFTNVAPSIGWTFLITPKSSIYASFGRTVRYPNRDELVGFVTTALDLDPERARLAEIGARSHEWAPLGGSVSIHWMDVHNEVFYNPPAVGEDVSVTFNFGQSLNVDLVRHRGVEFELVSAPCDRVELFGTLVLQRTEIVRGPHEGEEMPLTPRVAATLGGRVLVVEGLHATVAARYTGRRFLTNDIENASDPLDDYVVVDAKVAFRKKAMTLSLGVENLQGLEYFDNGGLRIPFGVFPGQAAFSPAAGRVVVFGIGVEF